MTQRYTCGIHVGGVVGFCRACAQARAWLDAELADVTPRAAPKPSAGALMRRLTDDDVARIRESLAQGIGQHEIARQRGVSQACVSRISRGVARYEQTTAQRRAGNRAIIETPAARAARQAIPPLRGEGRSSR